LGICIRYFFLFFLVWIYLNLMSQIKDLEGFFRVDSCLFYVAFLESFIIIFLFHAFNTWLIWELIFMICFICFLWSYLDLTTRLQIWLASLDRLGSFFFQFCRLTFYLLRIEIHNFSHFAFYIIISFLFNFCFVNK